jgi:hypothetical protein
MVKQDNKIESNPLNIQIINPIDYPGWDDLLLTNAQSTFFHTSAWARVLYESYKYKPLYFTIIENSKLASLIPIMEISSFLTGKRGVSLPFTDECTPIVSDSEQHEAIIEVITQHGKSAGWKHFDLRGNNEFLLNKPHSIQFYTHSLDLTQEKDKIFSTFRNSNKRNIKRAKKKKVEVDLNHSLDTVRAFYGLNCMTRKLHGLPPQPWRFFKNIYKYVISTQKGIIALASINSDVIAGAVYFHFGKAAIYKYGASNKQYQHLRANNLVMWEAIKCCASNDYQRFSLGRTEPEHEGLLQFKRGWGAEESVVKYYKYDLREDSFVAEKEAIKSSYNFFKVMPLPILRLTGNLLYRHMG